jgi:hypothetical protein
MTRARDTSNFVGTSTAGGKNLIPNGSFSIWQRGTSGTTTSYAYTCADKWLNYTDSGTVTLSQISVNGATDGTPPGVKYALRTNRTAGATADRSIAIFIIDGALAYVGQTLTLSFYMRIGAGITGSPFGNVTTRTYRFGPSTDSGNSTWNPSTFNSTTFTRVSLPITITAATAAAGADLFEVEIGVSPQATGTNTYFDLAGVQLELGTSATDFSLHGGTPVGELEACQKYFLAIPYNNGVARTNQYSDFLIMNAMDQTTWARGIYNTPVPMRTVPTLEVTPTSGNYYLLGSSGVLTITSISLDTETTASTIVVNAYRAVTAGATYYLRFNNNTTDFLRLTADY